MQRKRLQAKIDNATAIIGSAEAELARVTALNESAVKDGRNETAAAAATAATSLERARDELVELKKQLASVAHTEATEQLGAAQASVEAAERELDQVVADMKVGKPLQDAWVSDAVASAFAKLGAAKQGLLKLETLIASIEADE